MNYKSLKLYTRISISILLICLLIFSICSCKKTEDRPNTGKFVGKVINEIEKRIAAKDTNDIIYLRKFTNFEWDSLYILSTGLDSEYIKRNYNIDYKDTVNHSKNGNMVLLFTSKKKFIYKEYFKSNVIDFGNMFFPGGPLFYSKNSAVFRFKKEAPQYSHSIYKLSQIFEKDSKPTLFVVLVDGFENHEKIDLFLTSIDEKKKLFSGNLVRENYGDINLFASEIDRGKEYAINVNCPDRGLITSYNVKIHNNPIIFLDLSVSKSGFEVIFCDSTLSYY